MMEMWVNQAVSLSPMQCSVILFLSIAAIGLVIKIGKDSDNAQP